VWDHVPAAPELLDRRIALGWRPTPTLLRTGDRVLGYAGCAVTGSPHRVSGSRRVSESKRTDAEGAP
jgi:hypothetical protein